MFYGFMQHGVEVNQPQADSLFMSTTLNKGNARFPILYVTLAIFASRKPVLTFILCILTSQYEKLMN